MNTTGIKVYVFIACVKNNNNETITLKAFCDFQAFEELEELLAKYDICIAVKEKLTKDSGVAGDIAYDNIVLKLLTKPRARGK